MKKRYMIWWHSYVDDISRDVITLKDVFNSVSKALKDLEKLKDLEQKAKIRVKDVGTLNPLYIEILDKSAEEEVAKNPIVDVEEID